ncbi:hypothetical protein J2S05_000127 [Alkalicoccobacillus murimartini]|uniref:Right handed beta helix domain-containing protein n=1 Tax=Alkalicoccobacillus murimartini TaxID=171685 RepID=A0ABT9YBY3_9BACI|nr:right-handed parallel beta-helix repeat-containing protein [Alkalicoccobacillus murimartini]MDQ0205353.1 hypothetical protein [Alkalicoccobacillus murimartini]
MIKKCVGISSIVISLILTGCVQDHSDEMSSNELYVATNGNNDNPGTINEPLLTLEEATDRAVKGTNVFIREGTYDEPLIVQHSGSYSEPIVFQSYQDEQVRISGRTFQDHEEDMELVQIVDRSYITIKGLEVCDLSTDRDEKTIMGILVTGDSQHIQLLNNHIHHIETYADEGNAHGIAVYGDQPISNILIKENIVEDLKLGWSEALVLNGDVSDFLITENIVQQNNNIGIDLIGFEGTAFDSSSDFARDGTISHNRVHHNSSYGNPSYGNNYSAAGIYVDGGSDLLIQENKVYQNDIGIEATSEHKGKDASGIQMIRNTVYENHYTGISIGGYDEQRGGTIDSVIAENILYKNDTKEMDGAQVLFQYKAVNNLIKNNIMTTSDSGLFVSIENEESLDNTFTENVYHKERNKQPIWIVQGEPITSLEAFQEVIGSDERSIYDDPDFVDAAHYHFELNDGSPAKSLW